MKEVLNESLPFKLEFRKQTERVESVQDLDRGSEADMENYAERVGR
jgi:hypothetical protein